LLKKISFLVCSRNEEKGIARVLKSIPRELAGKTEVIVVDSSSDNTPKIAKSLGAKVIVEKKLGKGNAIRTGFKAVSQDSEFVVMLDADGTYDAREAGRLLELLSSGFCDIVLGSRIGGKLQEGSLTFLNRFGNWFLTFLLRVFYHANTTDALTGFVAMKASVARRLAGVTESQGFGIEMEMLCKARKLGYSVYSVPITYYPRVGKSGLNPFSDGIKIFWVWFKNLWWKP
jgi:glycosyltransferase involved in cell wall biosynthesis